MAEKGRYSLRAIVCQHALYVAVMRNRSKDFDVSTAECMESSDVFPIPLLLHLCLDQLHFNANQYTYSETSNSGLSEKWTNPMPPIALPIETVHLEPPRSGHLSISDNGQPACPQTIAACIKLPPRADGDRNRK